MADPTHRIQDPPERRDRAPAPADAPPPLGRARSGRWAVRLLQGALICALISGAELLVLRATYGPGGISLSPSTSREPRPADGPRPGAAAAVALGTLVAPPPPADGTPAQASPPATAAPVPPSPARVAAAPTVPRPPAATVAPTAATVPAATPTAAPMTAAALLERVARAEAALRSGQFDATLDSGGGSASTATLRFDLGGGGRAPALQITSSYSSPTSSRTIERVTIGDRAWERLSGEPWVVGAAREAVLDQVRSFLPHADDATDPRLASGPDGPALRWRDVARGQEVLVRLDAATGDPREARLESRATGAVLTVRYSGWDTPVEIASPQTP